MVGPKYSKPTAPLAPGFKEATNWKQGDGWKIAQPDEPVLSGKWWQLYGDAKLNGLEEQVDSANQTLKIAEANFRQARAAVRFQRAAEAPTIGTSPKIESLRASANTPYFPSSQANNGSGDFVLPVDLTYEVDLWGRVRRSVTAAKEEMQAGGADLETARLSLHAEVAIDYFEVRSADAQEKLLNDTVAAYNKALELTRNRYQGGAAPRSDVAQAQTQLDTARVLATDVMVQRAQYEHALAILIGKLPASFSLPSIPLNVQAPQLPRVPVTLPAQLLERRPDIAGAERRMAAANEQIGIAEAAYYPTLNLAATAGLEGSSLFNWFNWPSRFWAVGPALSETLFDAGRRRATTESARANYDATVANYRQTVLTSFQQVEDNLAVLRILCRELSEQHEATASAEDSLRLFQNRYAGGVDTYLQVVTAQATALANERNDIELMRRQLEANVLLIKAVGGGWNTSNLPVS
ncbi:efflux transporter outer membrane subunit [Occallatibacter riparius]|uniref:Efflux transporter outer membrane subunit n=2 Tax=Occallatibacter riparius TaxID=1002689 RepID=A0A9J7BJD5_9BACT|nr:efflux transporter outer membrane subunit [Occallatibacter riparius]